MPSGSVIGVSTPPRAMMCPRAGWSSMADPFVDDGGVDLPNFVTHYHLADRPPFLNLCDLTDDELDAVLADLGRLRRTGRHHRPFGRQYMEIRRATEARLRAGFVAAGGRPERRSPHYFVLGESAWYGRLGERMGEVRLLLTALPAEQTSWTCSDS